MSHNPITKQLLVVVATLAATATCLGPGLLDGSLAPVVRASDGGIDAGTGDAGADAGGFRVRLKFLVDAGLFPRGASISAVGPRLELAGFGNVGPVRRVFKVDASGTMETWDAEMNRVAAIRAFDEDGGFCGSAYWRADPESLAFIGTAVVGHSPEARRLLPDPLSSDCRDMNAAGTTVGEWRAQGFVRYADGGLVRLDLFPFPPPRSDFVLVEPFAINSTGVVVGSIQYGNAFGRGNPAPFLWSDGGALLLENGPRPASAYAVNSAGLVGGRAQNINSDSVPMLWPDWRDAGLELPLPPGFVEGEVLALDDRGLAAGSGVDSAGQTRALFWWKGRVWLLDDLIVEDSTSLWLERLAFANRAGRFAGTAIEMVPVDGGVARVRWPIAVEVLELPAVSPNLVGAHP